MLDGYELSSKIFCDELAVEAPVLDKDFVGALAGDDYTGEIDAGDVAFERGRITDRTTIVRLVQRNAEVFDEVEIGMVTGESEDKLIRDGYNTIGRGQGYIVFGDIGDGTIEIGFDLAVFDSVVDVGEDPVLDVTVHLRATMHESHLRSVAP